MKKKYAFLLGLLVVLLAMGLVLAGCGGVGNDSGSSGGNNSGGNNSGGNNSGGNSSGGNDNSGGNNSDGKDDGGGYNSGGTNSGGNNSGGNNSGGTNSGGNSSGGTNSGGTNSGGTNSGGNSSGGTNSGGTNSGGTNSGGTNSGGTNSGGNSSGGTNSGGTNSGGTNSGGNTFTPPTKDQIEKFVEDYRKNTTLMGDDKAAVYIKSITINTYTVDGDNITSSPSSVPENAQVQVKFTVRTILGFNNLTMGEKLNIDNFRVELQSALKTWLKNQGFGSSNINVTTGDTVFG